MKKYQAWGIGLLVVLTSLMGCAMSDKGGKLPVQGDNEYCIKFIRPTNIENWDGGRYTYAPWEGQLITSGARCFYYEYYPLKLSFGFKDGRRYREEINIEELMRELISKEKIFDNRNTKWGGGTYLEVSISEKELIINYLVTERIVEPNYKVNKFPYLLFRKELN